MTGCEINMLLVFQKRSQTNFILKFISKVATRNHILLLFLLLHISICFAADDACNGRCRVSENVFCNTGTGVCENCDIYCSIDSPFYSDEKCIHFCYEDIRTTHTDACSNRCNDFNDTYCNTATGVCDSCSIFCNSDSPYFDEKKCADLCPAAMVKITTVQPTNSSEIQSTSQEPTTPEAQGEKKANLMAICIPIVVCTVFGIFAVILGLYRRHGIPKNLCERISQRYHQPNPHQEEERTPTNDVESGLSTSTTQHNQNHQEVDQNGKSDLVTSQSSPENVKLLNDGLSTDDQK